MTKTFTDANFKEEVLNNTQLSVVDFWAEWCGPCKALGPTIESLAADYEGKVNIGKLDVDNNSETAMQFGITSIPAIFFIKNGEVVDKLVGAVPKAAINAKIAMHS